MEVEEPARKASASDECSRKERPAVSDDDDEDDDVGYEGCGIEEHMVEEVMKRLEEEINGQDLVPYYSSCSFVTINGNEESCGPSFSDSASTVMASIDMAGVRIWDLMGQARFYGGAADGVAAQEGKIPGYAAGDDGGGAAVGGDIDDSVDDEWLASVLSAPAFEFEEGFGF